MADLQWNLNSTVPPAKVTRARADEPRLLLDELVERKLSTLLAGETEPGDASRRAEGDALRA